jgi:hypothetical protein
MASPRLALVSNSDPEEFSLGQLAVLAEAYRFLGEIGCTRRSVCAQPQAVAHDDAFESMAGRPTPAEGVDEEQVKKA